MLIPAARHKSVAVFGAAIGGSDVRKCVLTLRQLLRTMDEPLVECSFPLPILRDGDRQPHQPLAWDDLTIELRKLV